jgi:hypothetical protein
MWCQDCQGLDQGHAYSEIRVFRSQSVGQEVFLILRLLPQLMGVIEDSLHVFCLSFRDQAVQFARIRFFCCPHIVVVGRIPAPSAGLLPRKS